MELVSWSLTSLFSTNMAISEIRDEVFNGDRNGVPCCRRAVAERNVMFTFVCLPRQGRAWQPAAWQMSAM